MKVIVGLGNPGREYEGTRHNAGVMLVEALASSLKAALQEAPAGWRAQVKIRRTPVVIATLPLYMNESGPAVRSLLRSLKAKPSDLILLVDDFQIPMGKLRLRPSGSSGGHKGLQSVFDTFSREDIHRLRIGTGRVSDDPAPPRERWSDYVLQPFSPKELVTLGETFEKGIEALKCWVKDGMDKAMSLYNG